MDFQFTEQIGEMLKQLEYINECDTFGQKTNKDGIHRVSPDYMIIVFVPTSSRS